MATLKDTSALNALNEKNYINKLYDTNTDTTKELLKQNYTDNAGILNNEQSRVQQQTAENVNRTKVEAQAAQDSYTGPKISQGASQQEALTRGTAKQQNLVDLQNKQTQADAEIARQRQLLASQYASAIKQAQADNDMQRAQQLYNAAKEEEAKLLSLRQDANAMMTAKNEEAKILAADEATANLPAAKEDYTIQNELLSGKTPTADYSGETWKQVLKNETALNNIYDKQLESQRLALQTETEQKLSDLGAKQKQAQQKTDQDLTQAYVDALKKAKNYTEVQSAYGQGSGTAAAARIARDTELQKVLTGLRGVQTDADASTGMQRLDIGKAYRQALADKTASINRSRAEALYDAAEKEEESLYDTQLKVGQEMAKLGDYSVLGKLYGLTQDQIDRLQGTGIYAPPEPTSIIGGESSSGGGVYIPDDSTDYYTGWNDKGLQAMANTAIDLYKALGNTGGSKDLQSSKKTKRGTQ